MIYKQVYSFKCFKCANGIRMNKHTKQKKCKRCGVIHERPAEYLK